MYKEKILNGADPVLGDGLLPVTIDNKGVVRKASTSEEWYSYEKKNWANAVILNDESICYEDYEIIPEEAIESYFVWIPKYSYELWDLGEYEGISELDENKVHTIPVKFGTSNTKDTNNGECTTPMLSGESGNCKVGDYMTHPAFISMNTNGLWVGKFESGYKGATSTIDAQVNSKDSSKLQIKPNVYSWRNIQVANAYLASYNYKREMDSHMMKNTEWGSVAYLSHSQYGSAKRIRVNNNSGYITGYAAIEEPTLSYSNSSVEGNRFETTELEKDGAYTINYFNPASVVASTTGNYTGIYDMSGGVYEYVMGVILDSTNTSPLSGQSSTLNSGFNGSFFEEIDTGSLSNGVDFPDKKYYDVYNWHKEYRSYSRRILGDATGELGPFLQTMVEERQLVLGSWYNNISYPVAKSNPWIIRGGDFTMGNNSGIFAFNKMEGQASFYGFRVVLAL